MKGGMKGGMKDGVQEKSKQKKDGYVQCTNVLLTSENGWDVNEYY